MNKLKKAIAELRDYLGKDVQGVRLLTEIETVANAVRKQAAAEKDRADQAIQLQTTTANALRSVELELARLRVELQQEQAIRQQRERDAESWEQQANSVQQQWDASLGLQFGDTPNENATESGLVDLANLAGTVRALRRWRHVCPTAIEVVEPRDKSEMYNFYDVYELGDVLPKISGEHFLALGRFVTVLALMQYPCIIRAKHTFWLRPDCTAEMLNETFKLFSAWYRKHIDPADFFAALQLKQGQSAMRLTRRC